MNIAICDDDRSCLEAVKEIAEKYISQRSGRKISFETFLHPEDLLYATEKNGGYDIYILDVVMPDMNGIQLGEKIRAANFDGKIIYLTSSEDYSLDAFRVKAFDYIIKPIKEDTFFKVVDEALALISERQDKYTVIKSKDRSSKVYFDNIMYAELNKRAVRYFLTDGRTIDGITLRSSFSEAMSELIADRRFYMCGQSTVVNFDHITDVEACAIVFKNTYKAFLGEKNCRKLRSEWTSYLFEQEQ